MGDWYYIGHYGQLGPLTREQIDELVGGGVIGRDTYVWRNGMSDWVFAERCPELITLFAKVDPFNAPPPRPGQAPPETALAPNRPQMAIANAYDYSLKQPNAFYPSFGRIKSDRSRTAAGLLQLFLPGVWPHVPRLSCLRSNPARLDDCYLRLPLYLVVYRRDHHSDRRFETGRVRSRAFRLNKLTSNPFWIDGERTG